ncbi:hypothetical protein EAG18_19505 [Pseudoalteromonas sp. J010]|uniref:hypothetical protein n=1 Tax=Pseudoalteromonas sp. J010 TaxID=998465 RepID=UPI000F654C21|nr:hypothetical protein [Pseudoalteromonas sp. J010]RRS06971.1 hypothetical protein EAG18_19505 [Pseudoalteromonas sp. J010]
MKQLLPTLCFAALVACTPAEITKTEHALNHAQQQRDIEAQANALKTLSGYDSATWQAVYEETQQAFALLLDAKTAYESADIVTAQIKAAQSKSINNSLQADNLLRALSTDYPLTELIDVLVKLHTQASQEKMTLHGFFNQPPSKWNIIEVNEKLSLINTHIQAIKKQIEAIPEDNRDKLAYQTVLAEARAQINLLGKQESVLLRNLQQQLSKRHAEQFVRLHHTVTEQLNNFEERVVASMIRQDQNKLIETMQHQSELLYNIDLMLKQTGSARHAEFEPFYLAYIQLLNKSKDYREYAQKGKAALTLLKRADVPNNLYQQYKTLASTPLTLSNDFLMFARSQHESKFLYRKH